ncbi:MAG: hypothetical protein JSS10_09090 [Verrucomicrobia bacterium]|nr:hypothetical protein [Verrucomicrobiota bacterium]
MNLRIAENYQALKQEVADNWTTGVAMTVIALVVGRIYGKTALLGVVVLTVGNYSIIGRQIRVFSWMNVRKTLIAVVVFGNSYYNVINPKMMSYIAVALLLADNFQLATVNEDLSTQNEALKANNTKLQQAYAELIKLKGELEKLVPPAKRLEEAKKENEQATQTATQIVPQEIQDIPDQLHKVSVLFKALLDDQAMQESIKYEADLRKKISTMLKAFEGFYDELKPLAEQAEKLSESLRGSTAEMQSNVVLTQRQVQVLKEVLKNIRHIPGAAVT